MGCVVQLALADKNEGQGAAGTLKALARCQKQSRVYIMPRPVRGLPVAEMKVPVASNSLARGQICLQVSYGRPIQVPDQVVM